MNNSNDELTVLEAVDHLSKMTELDLSSPPEEEGAESLSGEINWRDPKQALQHEPLVRETFKVIHGYLQHLCEQEPERLQDPETQRAIQAIMMLTQEAAQKMDKFCTLYHGTGGGVSKLKEYKELQRFYLGTLLKHFQESPVEEIEKTIEEEGETQTQRRGLRDLEAVRQDQEYELFFIKKENGRPYFNRELLRHLKLVGQFDQDYEHTLDEDPLLWVKQAQDRDVHEGAKEILNLARPYIDAFYKGRLYFKEDEFIATLNKALMALMMTAHNENLLENGGAKGCLFYYCDFHRYLRESLTLEPYQQLVAASLKLEDPFAQVLINLIHALCCFFFMRPPSRAEATRLIHKLIERGKAIQPKTERSSIIESLQHPFWRELIQSDENIRHLLKHFPNGPLLKSLDVLRDHEVLQGFDPLQQQNFPTTLFAFTLEENHVSILKIPSPTFQLQIQESQIAEEFEGFLRYFKTEQHKGKHLLVSLQDRTSWEDFARADCIEQLAKKAEFSDVLLVLTLPKHTDFYHQSGVYEPLHGAPVFIEQLKMQIMGGKECGFLFPEQIKASHLTHFVDESTKLIHQLFFDSKDTFSRRERLNFIEIFYHFLVLKMIELTECRSLSFTCKDAIDTGAAASAGFFAFLRLLSKSGKWSETEKNLLLWLFYHPALIVRERAVDINRLTRMAYLLDALESSMDKHRNEVQKAFHIGNIGLIYD